MMRTDSLKTLAFVVSIFFFTSNLSGSFLPLYYKEMGLTVAEIVQLLLFTFIVIGLLPLALQRFIKNFEKVMSLGIFATMLFFVVLIYIQNTIILGLTYGLSIATFWPSFNLLQFRLSESHVRARTVSFFSSIIPSLASIVGPALGGFIISRFSFSSLFILSIILYLASFLFSTRIKFKPEIQRFTIPKGKVFGIFSLTFILLGMIEAYWFAYPFFVHNISGTIFQMGLVLTASAILVCSVTFFVNWLSDIRRARVEFAIIGAILNALWYFLIASASTMYHIVALSLLSGLAGAFSLSWVAHYGDSFGKEYHASILVMMEVGLMLGRIINLAPTYVFITKSQFSDYFLLLSIIPLFLIPPYAAAKLYHSLHC